MFFEIHRGLGQSPTLIYVCAKSRTPTCGRDGSSGEAVPVGNGGVGRNCGQPGFWRVSLSNLPKSRPFTFLIHKVNYYCAGVFVAYALLVFYGKF